MPEKKKNGMAIIMGNNGKHPIMVLFLQSIDKMITKKKHH